MLNNFLKIKYKEYSTNTSRERFCAILELINGFRFLMLLPTFVFAFYLPAFWITSSLSLISTFLIFFLLKKKRESELVVNFLGLFGISTDFILTTTSFFLIDSETFEFGMNYFLLAIVIEAAYLWRMKGAIISSLIASIATTYWLFYRDDFELETHTITAVCIRFASFLIVSVGVGSLAQAFQDTTDDLAEHYKKQEETINELKQVAEVKDDFISVASHELRTPITSLFGYMNVVNDPRLDDERREEVKAGMDRQVKRLHDLAEDLLAVGLIDSKRNDVVSQDQSLPNFVSELIEDLTQANQGRIIDYSIAEEVIEKEVYGFDQTFLRRVLSNLIQNSINYSESNAKVDLTIWQEGNKLFFEVKDEGFGIEEQELENIFEKFHRAKKNRNISSTGLGLYIVKGLIEAMGGEVNIKSEIGVGTTINFFILI